MHDGVKVKIGERELVMPKLTVGLLKKHWPKLSALRKQVAAAKSEDEMLDALPQIAGAQVEMIHAALRRNHPELTLEELEDGLEMPQVGKLFEQLVTMSHIEKAPDGAAGEAESQKS